MYVFDFLFGVVIGSKPRDSERAAIIARSTEMKRDAARCGQSPAGVLDENQVDGCAAPLATAFQVVRDLAGDALVFVALALGRAFGAWKCAEIDHWEDPLRIRVLEFACEGVGGDRVAPPEHQAVKAFTSAAAERRSTVTGLWVGAW